MSALTRLNAADFAVPAAIDKIRSRSMVVGVGAGVLALIGLVTAPDQFYRAYLLAFMLCLGLSLRSEEHTSELQSLRHLVCRLLLEKKKNSHYAAHAMDLA